MLLLLHKGQRYVHTKQESLKGIYTRGLGILMHERGAQTLLILILSPNWVTSDPGWWEASVWALRTKRCQDQLVLFLCI